MRRGVRRGYRQEIVTRDSARQESRRVHDPNVLPSAKAERTSPFYVDGCGTKTKETAETIPPTFALRASSSPRPASGGAVR